MDLAAVKEWRKQYKEGLALPKYDWLIAEVERLTAELNSRTVSNNDLQGKVSRQAGMLADLRADLADAKSISCATVGHQGSVMEGYRVRAESAESELTALRSQLSIVEGERDAAKERGDRHMLTLRNNHAAAMRNHKEVKAELLQVKGERDRYREESLLYGSTLERIADSRCPGCEEEARAALHPATEETK